LVLRLDDERLALRAGQCRCRSAEPARIVFGGKVLDCELLSLSPDGAQACLGALVDVPDLVTLQLPGGVSRPMRCCWQNGRHVGLMVVGTEPLTPPAG
jgi:hypothetical protein